MPVGNESAPQNSKVVTRGQTTEFSSGAGRKDGMPRTTVMPGRLLQRLVRRRIPSPSGIDDDFTGRTAEQDRQPIQNVSAQDAFAPDKVRLQSARVILPVKPGPHLKGERCRGAACNSADEALHAQSRSQLKELTIRPRQDARICPCIGNDPIQDHPRCAAGLPELDAGQRHGFTGIAGVIGEWGYLRDCTGRRNLVVLVRS